jgi:hypothetical protein
MPAAPIKSASFAYKPAPFYTIQLNGKHKRYVAYFQETEKMKQFLLSFIENGSVQKPAGIVKRLFLRPVKGLLIKITDFENSGKRRTYEGEVVIKTLKTALEKYSSLLFTDGFHDFMVWRSTAEYMVIDDHGLIVVYTKEDYSTIFAAYGIDFKENASLIYNEDHWHIRAKNGAEDLKALINELNLR